MEKYYSNIIGTPVLLDDEIQPITLVRDIIIDPETGKLIALVVDKALNKIIVPVDIVEWSGVIRVNNWDVILDGDDVLRVNEVRKKGVQILKNHVVNEEDDYIGDVVDFSIDANSLVLQKLYTGKEFLGLLRYDNRIISAKNIIEILADKIIVKDDTKVKEKKKAFKIETVAQ